MPRIVDIAIPPDRTDQLLTDLERMPGLLGLRVQRGASVKPKGDLITATISRRALSDLMTLLDDRGAPTDAHTSVATSQPLSIVSASEVSAIVHDTDDSTWEEIEATIARETHMTINTQILIPSAAMIGMGLAGGRLDVAAQGLLRWAVDAAVVLAAALAVFRWKLARLHHRRMWL